MNIANLVDNTVAEVTKYQPYGGSNQLRVKRIKIEKEKSACHIKLV